MRRGALVLGSVCTGLVGGGIVVSSATMGCTTHQCDSDYVNLYPADAAKIAHDEVQTSSTGFAVWESSPVNGPWLDFPGMRTYFFDLPNGGGTIVTDGVLSPAQCFCPVAPPYVWVGTDPSPDEAGATTVIAGGELAEMLSYIPFCNDAGGHCTYGFQMTNSTCAGYHVYVSIEGTYSPPPSDGCDCPSY
jgi:hypothetical protein